MFDFGNRLNSIAQATMRRSGDVTSINAGLREQYQCNMDYVSNGLSLEMGNCWQ